MGEREKMRQTKHSKGGNVQLLHFTGIIIQGPFFIFGFPSRLDLENFVGLAITSYLDQRVKCRTVTGNRKWKEVRKRGGEINQGIALWAPKKVDRSNRVDAGGASG